MPASSQHDYRATELDPDLLTTAFEVQTNWHVITGAPSCGKTTLIDLLDAEGYRTIPEWAREYMDREIEEGRNIEEIHADAVALQRTISEMQLKIERGLPADEHIFLDGAVPGSLAWFRAFDLDPNEILPDCYHHRYASVFILDLLPHQPDGLRFEEARMPAFLDEWMDRDYCALGYDVIRVPVLPPRERMIYVIDRVPGLGSLK